MNRTTPHSVTGYAPAELFLKRQFRTRFSLLKPKLAGLVEDKQKKQKQNHDKFSTKLRRLAVGDTVRVRDFGEGKEKWKKAKVIKRLGPVTYLIFDGERERCVHIHHILHSREEFEGSTEGSRQETTPEFTMPAEHSFKDGYKKSNDSMTGITHAPKTPAKEPLTIPMPSLGSGGIPVTPVVTETTAELPESAVRRYPQRIRVPPQRFDM